MRDKFTQVSRHKGDSDVLNDYCAVNSGEYPYPYSVVELLFNKLSPDIEEIKRLSIQRDSDKETFDNLLLAKNGLIELLVDVQNWAAIVIERLERGVD